MWTHMRGIYICVEKDGSKGEKAEHKDKSRREGMRGANEKSDERLCESFLGVMRVLIV